MRGTKVAYTPAEVGKITGRCPTTVRRHLRKNRMTFTKKPGGGFLVPREEVVKCYRSPQVLESILPTVLVIGRACVQAEGFQIVESTSPFDAGLRIKLIDPLVVVVDDRLRGVASLAKRACPRAIVVSTGHSADPLVLSAWGQTVIVEEPSRPVVGFTR